MHFKLSLGLLASFAVSVSAHATFQQLWINGKDYGNFCTRLPPSNSPVSSPTSGDMACNAGTSPAKYTCEVAAGDAVTVEMHQQNGDRSCGSEAIGGQHYGPVIVYMAKVSDAKTAVGSSASWFKVSQMGLASNNPDYFAVQVLNNNCGHWTFKVPSDIAAGQYLIRAEVIALHAASPSGGAQFYMSCYQIKVTGGGSANPAGVRFPGAYSNSDPGIGLTIHTDLSNYVVPGPAVYGGGDIPMVTTAYPSKATWTASPSASPTPPGGQDPAPSTTGGGGSTPTETPGNVDKYGQCGGIGWSGATGCKSGLTCVHVNDYYYQCQ